MAGNTIPYVTEEALEQFATKLFEKVNERIEERIVNIINETSNDKTVASAKAAKIYIDEKLLNLDDGSSAKILTDTITGDNYILTVENGTLTLVRYSGPEEDYTVFIVTPDNRSDIGYTDETTELNIPATFTSEDGIQYKITEISAKAFEGCTNINAVTIPDSVTTIGFAAFSKTGLNSIIVPNNVTTLGNAIFKESGNLSTVVLSDNIATIPDYTFQGCTALRTITIPANVTSIKDYAFDRCTAISTVNFKGTEEQWNAITIGTGNDPIKNSHKVFNYAG